MMRKITAGLMILGAGALLITGCSSGSTRTEGQSDGATGSTKSIKVWMPPQSQTDISDKEAWSELLKPFEEEHGVRVDVTIVPWASYEEKFQTGVISGDGPDVGYMYTEMIGDYAARNQLVDLDKHLTQEAVDNYLYLDLGLVDGKQVSVPFVVGNARVLYYNAELLDQAGVAPPETWEEFQEASKKVAETGKTGFLAAWGDQARGAMNSIYFPFVWQAGGRLFAEDGSSVAFDSPENLEAAEFILSMLKDGGIPANATGLTGDQAEEAFLRGDGAFLINGTQAYDKYAAEVPNLGVIDSLESKAQGTFVAADSLVVFESASDKDLAAQLVQFITSGPTMEKFHEWADFPPITRDEEYDGAPEFKDLYTNNTAIFHTLPAIPNSTAAYNALYVNLQQMMLGQKTAEEALRDSATEGNAALTR